MAIRIFQVDAFTSEPFRGNPAGVCLVGKGADQAWMQGVAAEMNVSETAFVREVADGFGIRYFTPVCEVALCGHATLASAHILSEEGLIAKGAPVRFLAQGGSLGAREDGRWIALDFPALPVEAAQVPPAMAEAIGERPLVASRSPEVGYLLEMASEQVVRDLRPDFAGLRGRRYERIIVTARCSSGPHDFVSRFFAPDLGIDEDPVTGVAHCSLGPYWAGKLGKTELSGHQVSRRGGVVRVNVLGQRVELVGQAVTVMRGEIVV